MRIAIDARELAGRRGGVGRYLYELLFEWSHLEAARRHSYSLFMHCPWELSTEEFSHLAALDLETFVIAGKGGTWWEQMQLPTALKEGEHDAFFAPAYTSPLRNKVPTVLTIHDLSYFDRPHEYRRREGMRRRWITRGSARRARVILTDSEFSAARIRVHLSLPANRVRVIPLAARRPQSGLAAGENSGPRLILYLGALYKRRRLSDLIRAFARLADQQQDLRLEIVGANLIHPFEDPQQLVEELGLGERINWREGIDESGRLALLSQAEVFVFLSDYEGFGLPPLEAMAAGVPVLVADTSVAREVYGPAASFAPIGDIGTTAACLEKLLNDEDLQREYRVKGRAQAARYSWADTAEATLAQIEALGE